MSFWISIIQVILKHKALRGRVQETVALIITIQFYQRIIVSLRVYKIGFAGLRKKIIIVFAGSFNEKCDTKFRMCKPIMLFIR